VHALIFLFSSVAVYSLLALDGLDSSCQVYNFNSKVRDVRLGVRLKMIGAQRPSTEAIACFKPHERRRLSLYTVGYCVH